MTHKFFQLTYVWILCQFLIRAISLWDAELVSKLLSPVQLPGSHRSNLMLRLRQEFESSSEGVGYVSGTA